jgi:hypothetical protein
MKKPFRAERDGPELAHLIRHTPAQLQLADDASQSGDEMEEATVLIELAPHDGRLRTSRPRVEVRTR